MMRVNHTSKGMTLIEMTAVVVVTSIIALGMTMGTRGVLLHYQTDHVRQDLRQYGNNVMREADRELNLAQKGEVDGLNGFSKLKSPSHPPCNIYGSPRSGGGEEHLGLHPKKAGPRWGTPRASPQPSGAPGGDITARGCGWYGRSVWRSVGPSVVRPSVCRLSSVTR